MIELAGGRDVLGRVHTPSFRVTQEEIVAAAPEIILISPCGYGAQQARDEYLSMALPHEWNVIPAVQSGRVYALEANNYFSRPGPRLITGIEALAKVFHPSIEVAGDAESAALSVVAVKSRAATAASAH
jgi:iron complex transport system substrate-binding protein